jgi:glycosyltransferase involved in cell wall biosynthesis
MLECTSRRGSPPSTVEPHRPSPVRTVVHVSTVHGAGDTRIVQKECRSLIEAGYRTVLVVTSDDDPGVRGLILRRLPRAGTRLRRLTISPIRALRQALRERADLYHVHDPELIPMALILKALGKRVVYDAHEHLPRQVMSKHWIPAVVRRPVAALAGALEGFADRYLDGIVVANASTAARFRRSHTALVENFARVRADDAEPPDLADRSNTVIYVGGVSDNRGLGTMIDAIRILGRPDVTLVLIGPLEEGTTVPDLDGVAGQVELTGRLDLPSVEARLRDARVGLSVLKPIPNYMENYPTKIFEYMAAGVPVVASDFPLYRGVVDGERCGISVDPTSAPAVADAIARLLDDSAEAQAMADRGRAAVIERYSWNAASRSLLSLYERILST